MQYFFTGPKRDLQGFIAAKTCLPVCLWSSLKNESSAHENVILYEKEKTVIWWSGLELFFQVLLTGKKRVQILITSGLFTTWLSCPTDVCFESEQHEHMTGRQTIIPRSFIPLAFHTDLVTRYQTPVWVLYSLERVTFSPSTFSESGLLSWLPKNKALFRKKSSDCI